MVHLFCPTLDEATTKTTGLRAVWAGTNFCALQAIFCDLSFTN